MYFRAKPLLGNPQESYEIVNSDGEVFGYLLNKKGSIDLAKKINCLEEVNYFIEEQLKALNKMKEQLNPFLNKKLEKGSVDFFARELLSFLCEEIEVNIESVIKGLVTKKTKAVKHLFTYFILEYYPNVSNKQISYYLNQKYASSIHFFKKTVKGFIDMKDKIFIQQIENLQPKIEKWNQQQ